MNTQIIQCYGNSADVRCNSQTTSHCMSKTPRSSSDDKKYRIPKDFERVYFHDFPRTQRMHLVHARRVNKIRQVIILSARVSEWSNSSRRLSRVKRIPSHPETNQTNRGTFDRRHAAIRRFSIDRFERSYSENISRSAGSVNRYSRQRISQKAGHYAE